MGFSTDETVAGGGGSLPAGDGLVEVVGGVGELADVGVDYLAPTSDHGLLGDLLADDHTQYMLLAGRAGGQSQIGGTGAGDDWEASSTSHGTKGHSRIGGVGGIIFDESNARGAIGGAVDANWLWTVRTPVGASGLRVVSPNADGRAHARWIDAADARNLDFSQYGSTAGGTTAGISNAGLALINAEGGTGLLVGTGTNTTFTLMANLLVRVSMDNTGLAFYGGTPVAQGAAVADATSAVDVITRFNELKDRIEALALIAT